MTLADFNAALDELTVGAYEHGDDPKARARVEAMYEEVLAEVEKWRTDHHGQSKVLREVMAERDDLLAQAREREGDGQAPPRPKARDVGRIGDMGKDAVLRIGLDNENDVYVSVYDEDGGAVVEFCVPMSGGGKSPRLREALIAAMIAMESDNAESPHKDWWARRTKKIAAAPPPPDANRSEST